jgi:hypothetical protein
LSRFWGNAEGRKEGQEFRSLEVREASSSHLKMLVVWRNLGNNFLLRFFCPLKTA